MRSRIATTGPIQDWPQLIDNAAHRLPISLQRWLLRIALPSAIVYAGVVFGLVFFGASIIDVITDPPIPQNAHWYRAILSNAGIVLWLATGAICIFSAWGLSDRPQAGRLCPFLIAGGILSLMLGADDGLMLHDRLKHQLYFYATYAGLAGYIVLRHLLLVLSIDFVGLLLAGACLAGSILTDLVQNDIPMAYDHSQFLEEGLKFVGIICWSFFWIRTSHDLQVAVPMD